MADPAQIDITTDRRVDHTEDWSFLGVDWTGSTFKMQVRPTKDTTSTPLLDVSTSFGSFSLPYIGTATVATHIAAGRLSNDLYNEINPATGVRYVGSDSVLLSQLRMGLTAAGFLSVFPFPEERGDDFEGWYDIIRTPSAGSAELAMGGKFIVRAGVTIP